MATWEATGKGSDGRTIRKRVGRVDRPPVIARVPSSKWIAVGKTADGRTVWKRK